MSEFPQLFELLQQMKKQKLTMSFAESCTGGKLSAFVTDHPGVSEIFLGSVISYSNDSKMDLLDVQRDVLQKEGAVSGSVAHQMAQGVRNKFKSDWSVAITGIAGPSGGTPEKPVGTVYFAIAGCDFADSEKKIFSGSRKEIQEQSMKFAIDFLMKSLKQKTTIRST